MKAQHYRAYTKEEIEKQLTPAGGYLRKDLAGMGVIWPPMKGWKEVTACGDQPADPPFHRMLQSHRAKPIGLYLGDLHAGPSVRV